jgi:hypothetical protein
MFLSPYSSMIFWKECGSGRREKSSFSGAERGQVCMLVNTALDISTKRHENLLNQKLYDYFFRK